MYREEELNKGEKKLIKGFEKQWYPASDTPRIADFILWLKDSSYVITIIHMEKQR